MKIADLYIRVSTDEQAEKGYSQRGQEEVLRRYCDLNKITIRKAIFEDHSAKTFIRPQWQSLLVNLKKKRGQIDLILFTKWDRFSRNAPDAYQMINTLKILGVEPQAIEQPLNMEIPENKMMMAIYLTAPEIENDRRALNTFYGLRRAKKEGRWVSQAPVGYSNKHDEKGKKYIDINPPQAEIIKYVFVELAKAKYPAEQVYRRAAEMGLECKKNNFLNIIRNPVYCGRIQISKYKDEEAYTVKGLHEPIISECLFNEVQNVLQGKSRSTAKTKIHSPDLLPLRGFIRCSKCDRVLCGSASKGRNGYYYYYYHCSSACGCRYKAEIVNELFIAQLDQYSVKPAYAALFSEVLIDTYNNQNQVKENHSDITKEIDLHNNKVRKARELLLAGDIDGVDYKLIKTESEAEVERLEVRLSAALNAKRVYINIEPIVTKAIERLTSINSMYCRSSTYDKRALIGSMYPEKFTFEDLQHRTAKASELYSFIYLINSKLNCKKEGQATVLTCLPTLAPQTELEPYLVLYH